MLTRSLQELNEKCSGVAILAKKGIPAVKVEDRRYKCPYCCCLSEEKYILVLLDRLRLTNEYRIPAEPVSSCLSSFWALLRRQYFDQVLLMGIFNLHDKIGQFFAQSCWNSCGHYEFLKITNSFTQSVAPPNHKDGNVLDHISMNFNDPAILCIAKIPFFLIIKVYLYAFLESNPLWLLIPTAHLSASRFLTFNHWTSKFPSRFSPSICYNALVISLMFE